MASLAATAAEQALAYVLFGTPFIIILTAAITIPVLGACPFIGVRRSLRIAEDVWRFAGALHASGFIGNLLFAVALRDRLYSTRDPIVDWLPYFPSMDWTLDPACGGHLVNDASPALFYAAWCFIAIPVWLAAVVIYRQGLRRRIFTVV